MSSHTETKPPELRGLRILVIDDEAHIRFALTICLETEGHAVTACGTIDAALQEAARQAFDLIYLDVRLGNDNGLDHIPALLQDSPWARIVVITAYASISTAIDAMKLGATDYLPKPFEHAQLLLLTRKVAERRQLERNMQAIQHAIGSMDPEWDFPTASPAWRNALELARNVAATNAAILISGEPGTGRSRLARAIHTWSHRAAGPLVSVSLQHQSADQAAGELFGVATSQTGPVGAIAMSHGGTLLLEEVCNVPLPLQPRVLALLREKEFERFDAPSRRPIDVRVVAITSQNLEQLAGQGTFRTDLAAALNIVRIDVPALRERSADIPLLADRYLAYFAKEHHRPIAAFTSDAMFMLKSHRWPGNVRELRNVIERAALLCDAEQIDLKHLPVELLNSRLGKRKESDIAYAIGDHVPLETIEIEHIRRVIDSAGTVRRAATILEINQSTIFRKLRTVRPPEEPGIEKPAE